MKAYLDCDERYPVYSLRPGDPDGNAGLRYFGQELEITEEHYREYVLACDKYNEVQARLAQLWKEHNK